MEGCLTLPTIDPTDIPGTETENSREQLCRCCNWSAKTSTITVESCWTMGRNIQKIQLQFLSARGVHYGLAATEPYWCSLVLALPCSTTADPTAATANPRTAAEKTMRQRRWHGIAELLQRRWDRWKFETSRGADSLNLRRQATKLSVQ